MANQKTARLQFWRSLAARFSLQPVGPGRHQVEAHLVQTIQPVTPADLQFVRSFSQTAVPDLSGAVNLFLSVFTVPDRKAWRVWCLHRGAVATASYAIAIRQRQRSTVTNAEPIAISGTTGAAVVDRNEIWLYAGDEIGTSQTGNVLDTAIRFTVVYTEYNVPDNNTADPGADPII